MTLLHEDLARALVEARLAAARRRQLVRAATARSAPSTSRATGWPRLLRRAATTATAAAPAVLALDGSLEAVLDRCAHRVAEHGTAAAAGALLDLATATRHLSPGAAAALADAAGPEATRLRAFGVLHGVALRDLDLLGRERLLAELTGAPRPVPAERVVTIPAQARPDRRCGQAA